jgi:lipopolysaccharide transport system ATP-binding protein
MSEFAIRAEGLSKRYVIGEGGPRYLTLRDTITHGLTWPLRMARRFAGSGADDRPTGSATKTGSAENYLWALKDVSFDVRQGERVGIIGVNGAGKSTLLKVLSRITTPTAGRAMVPGRVSSLLEVGTGFHPELTGRENVYLNGTLLGMSRAEINGRFDEIVDFAGVEKFMDLPVKRYSSGMQLRLAFSVAAHLEPEIVMIDEVLAVGDARFQKKCLGKMEEIGKSGRTLLYVSHNLASISNLCQRAIILDAGKVVSDGPAGNVVDEYIELVSDPEEGPLSHAIWPDPESAPGNEVIRVHSVRILQEGIEGPTCEVVNGKEIIIEITYWNRKDGADIRAGIYVQTRVSGYAFVTANYRGFTLGPDEITSRPFTRGLYQSVCRIPAYLLNDIDYDLTVWVNEGSTVNHAFLEGLFRFHVHDDGVMRQENFTPWKGCVRPLIPWRTELIEENVTFDPGPSPVRVK